MTPTTSPTSPDSEHDMDSSTYLLLARSEQRERERLAADDARAVRVQRLRRLDRRAQTAASRARLARLVVSQQ